ncbi:MAG: universal stress protein YxiE [marine bacterium B5-7]|nr:MAG: universal stress protein YxiE [marine bacterium B5-7]
MINTVVVPVDGSTHSKKALNFACEIASKYESGLHLLHVTEKPMKDQVLALGSASVFTSGTQADLNRAARSVIKAAEDIATRKGCKKISTEIGSGDPAKRIIHTIKELDADLVVIGTRGLGELAGMLMGSVSHKVNQLSPCTCIVVR